MRITPCSRIIIGGAGIGGLVTALYLFHLGFRNVKLIESAKEMRALGLGINIQPEAVRVLSDLGLAKGLEQTGIATAELRYLDSSGDLIFRQPCGIRAGNQFPQYSIHRGELQSLLLAEVNRVLGEEAILTGLEIVDVSQSSREVTVSCKNKRMGGDCTLKSELLIGADGIDSAVRSKLHPGSESVKWNLINIWRGVTLLDSFLDGKTMTIICDRNWSRLVMYPISKSHAGNGKVLVNWVCLVPSGRSQLEYSPAWNKSGRLDDVLPYFESWDLGWLDVKALLSQSESILQYPMVDRDPLPFWSRGRITLIGDAAHLMYPTGGNGASQSILDAAGLAFSLLANDDIDSALVDYESRRRDSVYRLVLANRKRETEEWKVAAMPLEDKRFFIKEIFENYDSDTKSSRCVLN